ncbi:MAG: DUF2279 domain-containing protein [Crocinitomicaceae bacterium]|nr:DUF2279 domain-containing protein [Crocinitomicaceae bacterium]
MRLILFSVFFSLVTTSDAQDFQDTSDTVFSTQRFAWSTASVGTASIGSIYGLSKLWYSQEDQGSFHLFNDAKNWMQMDKLGHSLSCYHVTRGLDALFSWTDLKKRKSLLLASGISLGYFTTIEILDGFSESWGFSLSDMGFNAIGVGLYVFQEHYFKSQVFKPKFSFHQTRFAEQRPEVLGKNFIESLLKDYNGQTYWLSFSPNLIGVQKWPDWLMLSFGHSIRGRLKGDATSYQGITSHRELLLSLDVDLSKIRVKSKLLKGLFEALNTLKVPFPTLIYANGRLNARPIYF